MRPGMAHAVGACVQCRTRVRAKVAIEHLLEGGLCRPSATGPADATMACAKCMKSTRTGLGLCRISSMSAVSALGRLRRLGPIFRSKDAVEAGVSWRDLYRLRDDGEILELSRGVYQLAGAAGSGHVDFVATCARAPQGMICLNSAIAHWGLSDEIPVVVHLAVPEGSHRPVIDYPPTKVHVFRAGTFALGRLRIEEEPGEPFWITDPARTVVDAYRLRHQIGEDLAHAALREYLRSGRKQTRLAELAQPLRAWAPLSAAMRVLGE